MSADKYPSIFSRQMEAIVYLSMVAIQLGFQFGLYHVVVPLSFLRSINFASLFSWKVPDISPTLIRYGLLKCN